MEAAGVSRDNQNQNHEAELVSELQSHLAFLQNRVKELEAQNAKLSSLVSNCRCHKMEVSVDSNLAGSNLVSTEVEKLKLTSCNGYGKKKSKDIVSGSSFMHHLSKRFVALKVMYFGQRFYGFAAEAQMDPTVESEIFKALERTRLIFGDKKGLQYSRCGRTDKGVSSVGQVIALLLRSNCKQKGGCTGYSGELVPEELYEDELDYVRILNNVLPKDIRVMGWCPALVNFSARFSCLSREYKYFFWRENLNIAEMENAGKKLVGEHDFRNFCKMDATNVHNYKRQITSFEIYPCNERFEQDQLWAMKIKGSAFLWHQVRCMVAVLFLIGNGLESSNVINVLLDVDKTPRKPQYTMAPEIPLVLQSCEFEGLKFRCSSGMLILPSLAPGHLCRLDKQNGDARQALQSHLERECRMYKLQASIYHEALLSSSLTEDDGSVLSNRTKRKGASHIPLMSRPTEPSYEERRTKLISGTRNKLIYHHDDMDRKITEPA